MFPSAPIPHPQTTNYLNSVVKGLLRGVVSFSMSECAFSASGSLGLWHREHMSWTERSIWVRGRLCSSRPGRGYNFQATRTVWLLRVPSWQVSEQLNNDVWGPCPPHPRPRASAMVPRRQQGSGGLGETGQDILLGSHTGILINTTMPHGCVSVPKLSHKS